MKECELSGTPQIPILSESQDEEQLEFVMVCLDCLHVGCIRQKKGHGEQHFLETNKEHRVVRGIVGRLHCYECDTDIEVNEENMEIIEKIHSEFETPLLSRVSSGSPDSPTKGPGSIELKQEEIKHPLKLIKERSASSLNIEAKNTENHEKFEEIGKILFKNLRGLNNLGNTRYFNAMFQCLLATQPLMYFYLRFEDPTLPPLPQYNFLENNLKDYISDKRGKRMQDIVKEYYVAKGSTSPLTPAGVFEIICSHKSDFGSFSEQDSHDALLTLLDALADSQKSIYRTKMGITDKRENVENSRVPIGMIFGSILANKGLFFV